MRYLLLVVSLVAVVLGDSFWGAQTTTTTNRGPVVVELFTSEGCSSCPPADRLIAELQSEHTLDGAELILLGEHVDYWNDLGWVDRFAQHSLTERQSEYAHSLRSESIYTPQALVDGRLDVAGNDEASLRHAIATAANQSKPARVTLAWSSPHQLQVAVDEAGSGTRVLLFITEDNLTTSVKSGENGGTTLHHAAVVREIRVLGDAAKGSFHDVVNVNHNPGWQSKNLRLIVIAQQLHGNGPIVGAAALPFPEQPTSTNKNASR